MSDSTQTDPARDATLTEFLLARTAENDVDRVLVAELLSTADVTDRTDRDHSLLRVIASKYADHPDCRKEWIA